MAQSTLQYICDYCGRSFTKKHNTLNHIKNCHDNTTCFCDICEVKFTSPVALKRHLARGHNRFKQGNPECDLCGKIFTRRESVITHLQAKHFTGAKTPDNSCEVCNKKFSNVKNLKAHVKKLHDPIFEHPACDECNKVFRNKETLVAHIQAEHKVSAKDIYRCSVCEKVYSCQRNLKRHIVDNHGVKDEYKCSICTKTFEFNESMRRHVKLEHNIDLPKEFTCQLCSRVFSEQAFLDTHVSLHHKQDTFDPHKFTCECGKVFDSEPSLRHHIKSDHEFEVFYSYCKNSLLRTVPIGAEKTKKSSSGHDCEICQEHFVSLYDLRNHMKANHDIRMSLETCNVCFTKFYSREAMTQHQKSCLVPTNIIQCSQCEKIFTAKSSLNFHMKVFHSQQKPESPTSDVDWQNSDKTTSEISNELKCEYCSKIFKTKWKVQKHIECAHLGVQRFRCLECDSHFKENRNLRKHIRIKHPTSTLFSQCNFCKKRFESAKACKIHLKQIHSFDTNTYPCEICSATYNTNDSLTLHMKTKHVDEEDQFKCENCSMLFKGYEIFEKHKQKCEENTSSAQESVPRCVICMKDFSIEKSLKRHIRKFHEGFDPNELIAIGYSKRSFLVNCKDCLNGFKDRHVYEIYLKNKHLSETIVFKCPICADTYNIIEYAVQRYKITMKTRKRKQSCNDSDDKVAERRCRIKGASSSKRASRK